MCPSLCTTPKIFFLILLGVFAGRDYFLYLRSPLIAGKSDLLSVKCAGISSAAATLEPESWSDGPGISELCMPAAGRHNRIPLQGFDDEKNIKINRNMCFEESMKFARMQKYSKPYIYAGECKCSPAFHKLSITFPPPPTLCTICGQAGGESHYKIWNVEERKLENEQKWTFKSFRFLTAMFWRVTQTGNHPLQLASWTAKEDKQVACEIIL